MSTSSTTSDPDENDNAEIEPCVGESELIQDFAVGEIESYNAGTDSHNEESDHI